jgi:hypothetical protein
MLDTSKELINLNRRGALRQQMAERLPADHVEDAAEIAEAYLYLMRHRATHRASARRIGGAVLAHSHFNGPLSNDPFNPQKASPTHAFRIF